MKYHSKLWQDQKKNGQQTAAANSQARDFASPEELLRFDAARTLVPPELGERLKESARHIAPPAQPWWKKWFGR